VIGQERVLLRHALTVLTWLFIVIGPEAGGPLPMLGPAPSFAAPDHSRLQERTGASGIDPEHGPVVHR
jgi:hypothetical protein